MFAAPRVADQYVRLDHLVVDRASGRRTIVSELVLPAHPDDRMRLRHDFRDKAIINALDAYLVRTVSGDRRSGSAPGAASNDLGPVVRYFRNQLRDRSPRGEQTIARTELWYGRAPIPPPGQSLPDDTRNAREQALTAYAAGRAARDASALEQHALGVEQREADIIWTLEYIEWR
jgi:hypothetical protein